MDIIKNYILEFAQSSFLSKENVSFFFINVRQLLEREKLNAKYPNTLFFCNWLLHPELSRKNTTESILREMHQVIIEHLNVETDIETELSKKINLSGLQKEIIFILKELNINDILNKGKLFWDSFESILLHLLLEKPVLFDKIPNLEPDKKTNYNFKGFKLINHEQIICYELLSSELAEINSRIVIALVRD
tara:strand:+ start:69 stop:641 length:573 start_codon:yes stop_codon:yes gene_type:complete